MNALAAPTQTLHICPEHPWSQPLPSGSELFCQSGRVQLNISTLSLADQHLVPGITLHTGQSWRAPASAWVQLSCTDTDGARLQLTTAQTQKNRSTPGTGTERLHPSPPQAAQTVLRSTFASLWRLLALRRRFRRGQRAA